MTGYRLVLTGCRYGARWARHLRTWDLTAAPGEVVHLQAPNGTGKSTFLRAAVGLVPARWDHRELPDGRPAAAANAATEAAAPRYVASNHGVASALRLQDHARLHGSVCGVGVAEVAASLERWGVEHLVRRRGDQLSHGQHRAALLALALAGRPRFLVLDEPLVALDRVHQDLLVEELHRCGADGAIVVVAGHDRWLSDALPGREPAGRGAELGRRSGIGSR